MGGSVAASGARRRHRGPAALVAAAVAIAAIAAIAAAAAGGAAAPWAHAQSGGPCGEQGAGQGCTEVAVGALLARGEPFDEQRWAAFGAAVERFNGMQDGQDGRVLISLSRHDLAHGEAGAAVAAAHDGGAGPLYYLGPTFSGDVAGASGYVRENGLVAVSPSSSAPSLAAPGDGVFRITAPVDREAGVMARLVAGESVRTVVPAAQNGEFGTSTLGAMSAALRAAGVAVADPVRFDAGDAESWRAALAGIDAALRGAGPGAAVLVVAGFEEDFGAMAAAAAPFESARSARWFVPSGIVNPAQGLEGAAAEVAAGVRATTLALEDPAEGGGARDAVRADMAAAGFAADVYDYSASDAVFVLGGAIRLAAAGGANVSEAPGAAAARAAMHAAARLHSGALGDIRLDSAGDLRSPISYGVWEAGADGGWSRLGAVRADDSFCAPAAGGGGGGGCTALGIIAADGSAAEAAAAAAALLAVDEYNSIARQVYVEARVLGMNESASSPARAAVASADGPAAYVGPVSDAGLASLRGAAAEAAALLFSPASTDPSLAAPGDGVLRTAAAAPRAAAAAALGAVRADGAPAGAVVVAAGGEEAGGRIGGGAGPGSAAAALSLMAPSHGIGPVRTVALGDDVGAAADAAAAAAGALAAAAGDGGPAAAVVLAAASAAEIEGMAAAAADRPALLSARWYIVDTGGHTAAQPAGPALAALAASTSVSSVHAPQGDGGAAGRIGHAVGYGEAAPFLLYSAYDAAMLAAGSLGSLPAGSAAGNRTAAEAAEAAALSLSASYEGALGDTALDAAGDAAPAAAYARRAAPAEQGAAWAPAGSVAVPGTCGVSIKLPAIDFGSVRAGEASGPVRQTATNSGTLPLSLTLLASDWAAAAGGGGGGGAVLPASATEFSAGSGFAPLRAGPGGAPAGAGQLAPGASLGIDFRLNLGGAAADIRADTQAEQRVSYLAACE